MQMLSQRNYGSFKHILNLLFHALIFYSCRFVTPPLDEEEENERSLQLEAKARKELEDDGCPPCYPPDLDILSQNFPQEFQAIIKYWLSLPGTDDVVLCAQASDWRRFRATQLRFHRHLRQESLSRVVDKMRERRRRYSLSGEIRLLIDPRQQNRLEDWMEYQDYHLMHLDLFEKKQNESKQELDKAQKLVSDMNPADSKSTAEKAARNVTIYELTLKYGERNLEQHKALLHWIEQQRLKVNLEDPNPLFLENNDDQMTRSKTTRRTSACDDQKRKSSSVVLGQVGVTKIKSKKRDGIIQKLKHSEFELGSTTQNLDAIVPAPMHQATTPRLTTKEETSFRQTRSQKVSKAKSFAHASSKPLAASQRRSARQTRPPNRTGSKRWPAAQQPRPASLTVTTRSGRISKPPSRWAPWKAATWAREKEDRRHSNEWNWENQRYAYNQIIFIFHSQQIGVSQCSNAPVSSRPSRLSDEHIR